jgi:aldehyde dehydrogenase (NAD+)
VKLAADVETILTHLGTQISGDMASYSPVDGSNIGSVPTASTSDIDVACANANDAFHSWRSVPAPRRGELVRLFGNALREDKEKLARLVTIECGKPLSEGLGEVQEMIDICSYTASPSPANVPATA